MLVHNVCLTVEKSSIKLGPPNLLTLLVGILYKSAIFSSKLDNISLLIFILSVDKW